MKDFEFERAEFLYYNPSDWERMGLFWPVRSGISQARMNYRVGPKRIDYYSLHFVREGSLQLEFSGASHTLHAGDVFCLYPGITYTYFKLKDQQNLSMCWLAFDGPGAMRILEQAGFRMDAPFVRQRWSEVLKEPVEAVLGLMKFSPDPSMASSLHMQTWMCRLFSGLVRDEEEHATKESRSAGWIRKSIRYINLHAAEGITVQHVSNVIGVNRTYFSTVFYKHVGVTPMAYITKIRMEKAVKLLSDTTATITEIAYSLGYPDVYSFSRAFKNYYNISPSECRKSGDRSGFPGHSR